VRHELGYLIPTLEQAPVLGAMTVELQRHPKPHALAPVTLNTILVEEPIPPADRIQPIRWLLLTTLPMDTPEQICHTKSEASTPEIE
jgi:hypothetical protein